MKIDCFGNWSHYTNTLPAGGVAQGTITLGDGSTGALVYIPAGDTKTGRYVMVNDGCLRSVDNAALRRITV